MGHEPITPPSPPPAQHAGLGGKPQHDSIVGEHPGGQTQHLQVGP